MGKKNKKAIHCGTINMVDLMLNSAGKLNRVIDKTAFHGCKVQESEKTYNRSKQRNYWKKEAQKINPKDFRISC